MKWILIGCQVFQRELYWLCARAPRPVEIRWMPTSLHTKPQAELRPALQREIDRIEAEEDECEAILLAYGLCSMGTVGLKSRRIPLIIPRAHDCVTLLLGARERYQELFDRYGGGVYWYSPGWIEQFKEAGRGFDEQAKYMEYVEKYGEENAEYLIEVEKGWTQNYRLAALIVWPQLDMPAFEEVTRRAAERENLEYLRLSGSDCLLKKLIYGQWDDDFLRVEPGQTIAFAPDEALMKAEDC